MRKFLALVFAVLMLLSTGWEAVAEDTDDPVLMTEADRLQI